MQLQQNDDEGGDAAPGSTQIRANVRPTGAGLATFRRLQVAALLHLHGIQPNADFWTNQADVRFYRGSPRPVVAGGDGIRWIFHAS